MVIMLLTAIPTSGSTEADLYGRYKLDFEKLIANLLYTIFVFLALYSAGYALDRLNKIHKNLDRLVKHPLPPVSYRRRLTFAARSPEIHLEK